MISSILRKLPPFKGKQRVARILLKRTIERSEDLVVTGTHDCTYKLPNIQESIGFEIFINGGYEEETVDFIVNHIQPGNVFADIGANIGAITIPVLTQRHDIKAICLEAAPWIFEYLNLNIKENNLPNVTTINKAISSAGGQMVDFYSPHKKFGKGSLSPVFTDVKISVETITLTALLHGTDLQNIGLIKIDVEGFEYHAFAGGKDILLSEHAPDILFEFVDWAENLAGVNIGAAQSLLLEYGYALYYFRGNKPGKKLLSPLTKGSSMLFATKKTL